MNKLVYKTRRALGFTLMEVIAAIIILGILASFALPSFNLQILNTQNQEAMRALMAVWEAQRDYFRTTGDNKLYATDLTVLDVEFPSGLKYFSGPTPVNGTPNPCGGSAVVLATATSNAGGYTLSVLDDGRIVCSPCSDTRCTKMGFSAS